jgi:hypothetical protein
MNEFSKPFSVSKTIVWKLESLTAEHQHIGMKNTFMRPAEVFSLMEVFRKKPEMSIK